MTFTNPNSQFEQVSKNGVKKEIEVVPYNPKWPEMFAEEAERIQHALGDNCIAIHHIGSTSIPGLSAKPIIDILPVVRDILAVDQAIKTMEALGYEAKGEYGIAFRRYFQKGREERTHNVHVYEEGDPEASRYIKFRDWMRSHEEDAKSYAILKLELAAKFPRDILQYCSGKDAFVASIDAKDGFDGWRMVQALTDREWTAVQTLRKTCFGSSDLDPFTWTFKHKEHVHFIFYKNAEIIGYAHLQLCPENMAVLRMIVIDERYRNLGFGSRFLQLCERWLCHQGYNKIVVKSSQTIYKFYQHCGYTDMSWNDPDAHKVGSQEIEMGKTLTVRRT
ncbi:MAG: GNAT family N-acetyltransferase [Simkania sp.]|nr:GNAT family N-acetyltransferase [Simkania sp.]